MKRPRPVHGWVQTVGGRMVFPLGADPRAIDIEDIAHALSNICRFNGHCREFYSVAQHSVLVSRVCERAPLLALLHDASEAYIGDMVRPVKRMVPRFGEIEKMLFGSIAAAFGLPARVDEITRRAVAHADNVLLATELRDLMGSAPWPWHELPKPLEEVITPLPPLVARDAFIGRYEYLTGARLDGPTPTQPVAAGG